MNKKDYEYLAKCLAASMTAYMTGNTVEHEMRVYKNREPGDMYYAIASLLVNALQRKIPEDVERLGTAVEGHPK